MTTKWEDELPNLLTSLEEGEYAEAENRTTHILSFTKDDNNGSEEEVLVEPPSDVLLTIRTIHIRALIAQAKYSEALECMPSFHEDTVKEGGGGDDDKHLFVLEEAYCLYRLGRFVECKDILSATNTFHRQEGKMNNDDEDSDADLGLFHLLAQCHYRLHETTDASKLYQQIHDSSSQSGYNHQNTDETLTNWLAVLLANTTIAIKSSSETITGMDDNTLNALQERISDYPNNDNVDGNNCYELLYNYGTQLLLTSTSIRQKKQALTLLSQAQEECQGLDEDASSIQANCALAKLAMGDNLGSTRSFLELIIKLKTQTASSTSSTSSSSSSSKQNVLVTAENNMAVLNSQRDTSVFGWMKHLPDMTNMDTTTFKAMTPHQIRTLYYNRCILYATMGKSVEFQQTVKKLKESVSTTTFTSTSTSTSTNSLENILWLSRLAMVECWFHDKQNDASTSKKIFTEAMERVTSALKQNEYSKDEVEYLETAQAELLLYQFQRTNNSTTENHLSKMIQLLESLPSSIQTRPATMATLTALYNATNQEDKVMKLLELVSEQSVQKSLADFKLSLGFYADSAALYESILDKSEDLSKEELLECQAGYIKALSYIDIDKALELSSELSLPDGTEEKEELDGEELEGMTIPRLIKSKGSLAGSGSGSGRIQRLIGTHLQSSIDQPKKEKQTKEAIQRKRDRKREIHLQKLQSQGNYNPNRPTKPDPERWIPKSQRSYSKRGRKGRSNNKFVGAQGIAGTGKDAMKLDAAARAAARAQGKDLVGSNPSTVHLVAASDSVGKNSRK